MPNLVLIPSSAADGVYDPSRRYTLEDATLGDVHRIEDLLVEQRLIETPVLVHAYDDDGELTGAEVVVVREVRQTRLERQGRKG